MCDLSQMLLDWYDVNAREMPWRIGPSDKQKGILPDPYHVWMSEIMLQQTTVAAVRDYFLKFLNRWPTVQDLAEAEDADVMGAWAGLGYYARARNLLKCARVVVAEHDGVFPKDHAVLLTLPGIGPYTASAIASITFDDQQVVVDGNVERVMARLFDEHTPLPTAKSILTEYAGRLTPDLRTGDYAQAVMDLGATICSPKSPACGICPCMTHCEARKAGTASILPKKLPKKAKPTRHGVAYLARHINGGWFLERRPEKGLLGGMLGWPGSDWVDVTQDVMTQPPFDAPWVDVAGEVRHTFTHFHLILTLRFVEIDWHPLTEKGEIVPRDDFRPSDLPTLMRKAFDLVNSS